MLTFDVLVIGSGGAGMRAALEAGRQQGLNVGLMTKMFPTRSATGMAQGGINGALKNVDPSDTIEKHCFDTVKGSDYLGDQDAIEFFVNQAPEAILEVDYFGVPFSRTSEGKIAQRNFGGQSSPRTCYSADKTGHALLHTMYEQCLKHGVKVLSDWQLLDLVVENNELRGVVALDIRTGEVVPVMTKAIVIATGGAGRMYWLRTTNPYTSTGDGMAAAFRSGIALKDAEMIQFHPTGLAGTGILMSEAVRGEGGYLRNKDGERFMQRYAPEKMELATRDVVAKAIEDEIKAGRGFGGDGMGAYVVVDVTHLDKQAIAEKLHGIRDLAIAFEGVDPIKEPIPIRPTCHYTMGGIDVVDFRSGATAATGVYAAGEAACVSIHGANRLGGNSLADIMVFGRVAGRGASECARQRSFGGEAALQDKVREWQSRFSELATRKVGPSVPELRDRMASTMWYKVGIFRNEADLESARQEIDSLMHDYQRNCVVGDNSKIFNTSLVNYIELGNMLAMAKAVVLGAANRKESRGCHLRDDYTKRDDEKFLKHSIIQLQGSEYKLSWRPVVVNKYQPAERRY